MTMKHRAIGWGLSALGATGAHRLAPAGWRGVGAILMFHHVRPFRDRGFAPNRELEITPEFLDLAIAHVRGAGFRIVSLDRALEALDDGDPELPVAALTFDDGYRDFEEWALPILRRAEAPATLFVTTGFADRTAAPWWIVVEEALARLERIEIDVDGAAMRIACADAPAKERAGAELMPRLRAASEDGRGAAVGSLIAAAGIDTIAMTDSLCLSWDEIASLAADPLLTIGAHTLTHPMLAKLDARTARAEMAGSKSAIEARTRREVRHFAYPVGDSSAAGPREFACAREIGFASAVTTRPGMLFGEHIAHLHALPRLSVNGRHQSVAALRALLSGAPFALWNRARRLNVA
jgi:peptidoglycan/xylan/chitin deacetylase (PgdA/CDA1 family)